MDLPKLPSPALRALHNAGFFSLEQVSKASRKELLALHGMGPKAMRILDQAIGERVNDAS